MISLNKKGFSIIEILVGIFIFSLGIVSIYVIMVTTLRINDYNENYIIASNLAREQIELIKNIRDSNYSKIQNFNQINPGSSNYGNVFEYDNQYIIENDYSPTANFPIKITNITGGFNEGENNLTGTSMQGYNICLDSKNRYTYNCSNVSNIKTHFYKYVSIEKVQYNNAGTTTNIDNAFIVNSKVIWYKKGYHEFEIKSIVTDFKRL